MIYCRNSTWIDLCCVYLQYNIKKKEEIQEQQQEEPNPLMRKKKTPEELAREAEAEEEDEFTSKTGSGRTPHNTPSHPAAGWHPERGALAMLTWFHMLLSSNWINTCYTSYVYNYIIIY